MQSWTWFMVARKVAALALLGAGTAFLAGPVAVVAAFSLLGLGVYTLLHLLWNGELPPVTRAVLGSVGRLLGRAGGVLLWPFRLAWRLVRGGGWLAWHGVRLGWTVGSETAAGTILGAALGVVVGLPMGTDQAMVPLGSILGGMLGLATGVGHLLPRRQPLDVAALDRPPLPAPAPAPAS